MDIFLIEAVGKKCFLFVALPVPAAVVKSVVKLVATVVQTPVMTRTTDYGF